MPCSRYGTNDVHRLRKSYASERIGDDLVVRLVGGVDDLTLQDYFLLPQTWTVLSETGVARPLEEVLAENVARRTQQSDIDILKENFLAASRFQTIGGLRQQGYVQVSENLFQQLPDINFSYNTTEFSSGNSNTLSNFGSVTSSDLFQEVNIARRNIVADDAMITPTFDRGFVGIESKILDIEWKTLTNTQRVDVTRSGGFTGGFSAGGSSSGRFGSPVSPTTYGSYGEQNGTSSSGFNPYLAVILRQFPPGVSGILINYNSSYNVSQISGARGAPATYTTSTYRYTFTDGRATGVRISDPVNGEVVPGADFTTLGSEYHGRDRLFGDAGNDVLLGGGNDDYLDGVSKPRRKQQIRQRAVHRTRNTNSVTQRDVLFTAFHCADIGTMQARLESQRFL